MKKIYNQVSRSKMQLFRVSIVLVVLGNLLPTLSFGQAVTQTESHESTIFPAPGWKQFKTLTSLSGAFSRQPYAGSINPTVVAPPGGGLNSLMFNSFTALVNDTSILITKPFDFSQNGGTNPIFSFQMYRDNGFTLNNDRIEVFINTVPSTAGMVPVNHGSGTNFINRPNTSFPVSAVGWQPYTFSLNAATYNQRRYYFIIRAVSADGNNIYLDNFTTNTYPSIMFPGDVSFDLVQQNQSSTSAGQTNQWILGVRCIVNTAGLSGCGNLFNANLPVKLDSLLFNTNGTSNIADISNAKIFYTGGSGQFNSGYVSPFPVAPAGTTFPKTNFSTTKTGIATNIDFDNPAAGPCFYLEYDTTYFWLTYDIAAGAAGSNYLDADFRGAAIGGTGGCPSSVGTSIGLNPSTFTLPGSVQIDLPYCIPLYTVGTSYQGYTNNDYVNSVLMVGYGGSIINTSVNSVSLQATTAPCYPNCNFTAHPPDYEFRAPITGQTVIVQEGGSYPLNCQVGVFATFNVIAAWIDWNRDGDFIDVGEKIGEANLNSLGTAFFTVNVPLGTAGNTRMRVREVFANTNISPCATYTFGECEDFVVTIIPNCSSAFRLWLGNTNDWNNPSNWCPSIPTINDSVVVDKAQVSGAGSRAYFNPTIKSGITANCKGIYIASTDTLIIDAPNPGSGIIPPLKVKGSVTNNGQIKFNTGYNPEVSYSTGTLLNFTMTPLPGRFYKGAQTQIIYTAAELAAQGILNGDRITALKLNIKNNDLSTPIRAYQNFQVSYRNDAGVPLAHATTAAMAGPFTTALTPTTLNVAFGWLTITLTTPIIVNPANNLCIQFCYSNPASTGSANNDYIDITQTTGRNSILILGRLVASVPAVPAPCSFVGTVASDITANGSTVASPTINALAQLRPNVTFVLDRPYTRPTVVVQGNFINNNSFLAGRSLILLDSASTQRIGGTQPSTFFDLEMAKTTPGTMTLNNARPVIMDQLVTVQDTLKLTAGQLIMNGRILTMTNPNPEAFWRTQLTLATGTPPGSGTGFLISESVNSQVDWQIGNYVAPAKMRYIPFGNRVDTAAAVINYIPFGIRHTAGDIGTFSASTYYAPANLPLPPTVTHLNTFASTTQNVTATADRFWMVGKTGANPIADLSFRISNTAAPASERATGWAPVPSLVKAQPWRVNGLSWLRISDPLAVASQATISNASGTGVIVTYTTALPHNFRVGTVITTAAINPPAYNLVGAVIASVGVNTFTVNNAAVGVYVLSAGTVTPVSAAVGATNYVLRQTTLNYAQGYGQYAALGNDSVRVASYDWPIVPAIGLPYNTPAAPIGDFTPWALASNNTPLPIELVDFKATAVEKQVRLNWETATETNNDYFTIERSRDLVNFEEVGQMKSQLHNSYINLYYQTWDEQPLYGMSYYRLKQTDFNGEFTYSDYRAVWFGSKTLFDITNVFSEPSASNGVNIDFVYNSEEPLDVIITDLAGRVILTQTNMSATSGTNRIRLNKALTRGIYFITLQNSEEVVSRKFIF